MRLPISLLILAAIGTADPKLPASDVTKDSQESSNETSEKTKSEKRELFEGNYGLKKGAYVNLVTPGAPRKIKYADELKEELSEQPTHGGFGSRLPQLAKISDVLSGHGGPFEAAVAKHLYSPVSIYQSRAPSVKTYKLSQPIPSQLAYAEHEVFELNQNHSKERFEPESNDIPSTERPRFIYKNTSPDDSRQDKLLHLESAYPRLEPGYLRPGFLQKVLIQSRLPQPQPELFPRFGLHHLNQLPLKDGNLKPVEIFHRQSLVKLVPVAPGVNYGDNEEIQDGVEEKEVRKDYEEPSPVKPSISYLPASREPIRPIQFYNLHPQGAVSHSSYYQEGPHSSTAPQPPKPYSPDPQILPEFPRYKPAIQGLPQLPIQYKLIPLPQPAPKPIPVLVQQPEYLKEDEQHPDTDDQTQYYQREQNNVRNGQDAQFLRENVPRLRPQPPEIYHRNQQLIENQTDKEPQINIEPQNMIQMQTSNEEYLYHQTLIPYPQMFRTLIDPRKHSVFQTTKALPTTEPIEGISITPEPTLQNEIQASTIITPYTTTESDRFIPPSKPRTPRPLPPPRPFYTRKLVSTSRTTPFPAFRRHPTTRKFVLSPKTTVPTITTTSAPEITEPTEFSSTFSTTTTTPTEIDEYPVVTIKPKPKFLLNHDSTTTQQSLSLSTELESIVSSSPRTYPDSEILQTVSTLTSTHEPSSSVRTELPTISTSAPESEESLQNIEQEQPIKLSLSTTADEQLPSQTESIIEKSLFQPQSIEQPSSQQQPEIQHIEQSASQTQPTEQSTSLPVQQESHPKDVIQHLSHAQIILEHAPQPDLNPSSESQPQPTLLLKPQPQPDEIIQTTTTPQPPQPQPDYSSHPDLPPRPLPGVIYDLQSQPQASSQPLIYNPYQINARLQAEHQTLSTGQPHSKPRPQILSSTLQYETHSTPQPQFLSSLAGSTNQPQYATYSTPQPDTLSSLSVSTLQPQYETYSTQRPQFLSSPAVSTSQPQFETYSTPQPQIQSTLEPQFQSLSETVRRGPDLSRPVTNLRPVYFPIPTPSPESFTTPSEPTTPSPQSVSTIVTQTQPVVSSSTPIPYLENQEQPKASNPKFRPTFGQTYLPPNPFLNPVHPVFQPHVYSQSQEFIFRPDFQNGQEPVFTNVQYFGNYAEAIFGRIPHSFRDFRTDYQSR